MVQTHVQSINSIEIHQLNLKILTELDPVEARALLSKADSNTNDPELLSAYIQLGDELRWNPGKYDSFENVCSALYFRSQPLQEGFYNVTDMYCALFNTPTQYYRYRDGETHLSLEKIQSLCQPLKPAAVARLWENMFLSLDPEIATPGRSAEPELGVFNTLKNSFKPVEWTNLVADLTAVESHWVKGCDSEDDVRTLPEFCHGHLYMTIKYYQKRNRLSLFDLHEIVSVHRNTWSHWKKAWMDCEEHGFEKIPTNRLSRCQMIELAKAFKLSVGQAHEFLMMAGYRFTEADEDVSDFLMKNVPA